MIGHAESEQIHLDSAKACAYLLMHTPNVLCFLFEDKEASNSR